MSATPEQIAETTDVNELRAEISWLEMRLGEVHKQRIEAETVARAQAERVRVLEALLQRLEPSIGWRSATGTSRDFACEFCHQMHSHFAHIEHTDACPVTQVRAALKAAP